MKKYIPMRYVRSEYGKRIRKEYESGRKAAKWGEIRTLEPRPEGIVNTITSVQKDNLILEVDGMIEAVTIRQATKAGVIEWKVGGIADLSFPTSKTRRGRVQEKGNVCPALMANSQDLFRLEADELKKYRIRNLTPRECWRLMGLKDEDFDKAAEVNKSTHLYAQAGNAIVVDVLEAIFKNMLLEEKRERRDL